MGSPAGQVKSDWMASLRTLRTLVVYILSIQLAPAGQLSRVFVYSQRESPARTWTRVGCDGENIAEIKRGFFFAISLPSGSHVLSLTDGIPVSVEVRPGVDIFVRVDWNYDVRRSPIPVLSRVAEQRATQEMRFLSYVGANRIHSPSVPASAPPLSGTPRFQSRQPE